MEILNFVENLIYFFVIIGCLYYFFIRYNRKFILNYIKLNFPEEYITLTISLHPLIYIFPFILFIITCYFFQIYSLINYVFSVLIGIVILLLWLISIVTLSITLCFTNERIIKISSIVIFKFLVSEINIKYRNINNLKLYKYGYSTEILIDDDKKRYRLSGISNIEKVYNTIKSRIN